MRRIIDRIMKQKFDPERQDIAIPVKYLSLSRGSTGLYATVREDMTGACVELDYPLLLSRLCFVVLLVKKLQLSRTL
jgi:hypothetical protein